MASKKILIVGAGISGLAAAHRVLERAAQTGEAVEPIVVDAADCAGGVIRTETADGFLIEHGPDNFITQKPEALELTEKLGLSDQLIRTNDAHRGALLLRDGALHPVPEGFLLMAPSKLGPILKTPLLSWRGKLRMAWEYFIPGHPPQHDESLASFVRRRFGREALDRMVQPLIGGIYTADPETLSLRATMPRFLDMEAKHGSLIRAMRRQTRAASSSDRGARYSLFVSFAQGMSTMTDSLVQNIGAERFRFGTPLASLRRTDAGWSAQLADGETFESHAVVLACRLPNAAVLLRPTDATLADRLAAIRYASSAVVNLGYRASAIERPLDAFGFVVPAVEKRRILAASFSSVKYAGRAPESHELIRVFLGGATQADLLRQDDATLIRLARDELSDLLGIREAPVLQRLTRWPGAMPQCTLGHLDRIADIQSRVATHPGLALAGSGLDGVGIPESIRSGAQAVDALWPNLAQG